MSNFISCILNFIGGFLESTDSVGTPISLKYKGRTRHKTICGGLITIAIGLVVIAFAAS